MLLVQLVLRMVVVPILVLNALLLLLLLVLALVLMSLLSPLLPLWRWHMASNRVVTGSVAVVRATASQPPAALSPPARLSAHHGLPSSYLPTLSH